MEEDITNGWYNSLGKTSMWGIAGAYGKPGPTGMSIQDVNKKKLIEYFLKSFNITEEDLKSEVKIDSIIRELEIKKLLK